MDFLPILVTTEHRVGFSELYSRFSFVICVIYIVSIGYICQSQSPNSSHSPASPLVSITFVLCVCVSISVLQIKSHMPFKTPHICINIQYLLFYLILFAVLYFTVWANNLICSVSMRTPTLFLNVCYPNSAVRNPYVQTSVCQVYL